MSLFIKTENFNSKGLLLSSEIRKRFIEKHKSWVNSLRESGINICSGYLTNKEEQPGGGGLLLIEAKSFDEAKKVLLEDPMIKNKLVTWKIQQWISVAGTILETN